MQYTALGAGLTVVFIITKEAVSAYIASYYSLCICLLLFIPFWILLSLYAWVGELSRMRRGSVYLAHVERSMSSLIARADPKEVFGFHSWLMSPGWKAQLKIHYIFMLFSFIIYGSVSLLAGAYLIFQRNASTELKLALLMTTVIFLGGLFGIFIIFLSINKWDVPQNLLPAKKNYPKDSHSEYIRILLRLKWKG